MLMSPLLRHLYSFLPNEIEHGSHGHLHGLVVKTEIAAVSTSLKRGGGAKLSEGVFEIHVSLFLRKKTNFERKAAIRAYIYIE